MVTVALLMVRPPVAGMVTPAPVSESAYAATADSAGTYRWDSTDQQYIYNWGTDSAGKGYYHRIGVKLLLQNCRGKKPLHFEPLRLRCSSVR